MTKDPPPSTKKAPGKFGGPFRKETPGGDRPTVVPPFDLEKFARSTGEPAPADTSDHDTMEPPGDDAPPTMVPAAYPDVYGALKSMPPEEEAPTVVPPRGDRDASQRPTGVPDGEEASEGARRTMPTLEDEQEVEAQRLRSVLISSDVPPPPSVSRKLPAPARVPSRSMSALSLADARLPTPPAVAAVPGMEGGAPNVRGLGDRDVSIRDSDVDTRDTTTPAAIQDPVVEMKDRFSLGDYSGALALAESILVRDPENYDALRLAEECQRVLIKLYAAKIGPLDRVPMLMVQPQELRWLSIDHRAGFLLSLVDGMSTIEMILDVSGMPLLDTLRILHELYQQRIISFRA